MDGQDFGQFTFRNEIHPKSWKKEDRVAEKSVAQPIRAFLLLGRLQP
jgi:hypothetical protein